MGPALACIVTSPQDVTITWLDDGDCKIQRILWWGWCHGWRQYCVVYDVVAPFQLETRRWEAGGRDIVVKADGPAPPGPDVEQRDVIPPVPAGATQWNKLLVLENETDLWCDRKHRLDQSCCCFWFSGRSHTWNVCSLGSRDAMKLSPTRTNQSVSRYLEKEWVAGWYCVILWK